MPSTTRRSVRFAEPPPGPALYVLSALAYTTGAMGIALGAVFWVEGMNPRALLWALSGLLLGVAAYAWIRGGAYTVTEAQVVLLAAVALMALLSSTTEYPYGALRNGVTMPLLGVYAGWFFRRPAIIGFYMAVGAWVIAVAGHGRIDLTTIALALAGQAVLGLEVIRFLVRRLHRVARTDPLTGVLNRLGLDELGHRWVLEAHRDRRPFCVALIDLDGLREVNNSWGHARGDELLRHAAAEWAAAVPLGWVVGRLGGDEFLILMPDTTLADAGECVDAMQAATTVRWTAGLAELETKESFDALVRRADHGMYDRKYR